VRATWLLGGLALTVTLMTVGACGATSAARPVASHTSSAAVPSARPAPMVTSAFAGLVLSHPASWAQFFLSPSDSDTLDPQATGYLTNEPVPAACRGTAPATVVCGQPVTTMGSGGVYVTVEVLYQQPMPLSQTNGTIGGYPADIVIGPDPGTYGCPAATARVVAATLARSDVQPSEVWIFACLGGPSTHRTQQQVMSMLGSARIAMRPPATEPVPGAPMCTSRDLILELGPPLSLMTEEQGLVYAVLNIGRGTCRLSGYPQVQLSAHATRLPFRYQDGGGPYLLPGRPPTLYLRPGVYAWFQIDTSACEFAPGTAATTAWIALPGQTSSTALPAETRAGIRGFSYCGSPGQTLFISALTGY